MNASKAYHKLIYILLLIIIVLSFASCKQKENEKLPDMVYPEDVPENNIPEKDENISIPENDDEEKEEEEILPKPEHNKPHIPEPPNNNEIIEITKIEEIEKYLDMVYRENINRVWFSTYSNITQYYGYMFLYGGVEINPITDFVNVKYKDTRPGIIRTKIDYIVIHDTGNNTRGADGNNHSKFINNNPGVSWHYTVDTKGIYHHIPDNEVAYHAGDGLRKSGSTYYNAIYKKTSITGGNMNGIGIETCVDSGSDYGTTLFNTANLVSELMIKHKLKIEDVKRHYDFSGKMCPQALIKSGYWEEFINYVKICYFYKTELSDVTIRFESKSKYMDDLGRVSLQTPKGTIIDYVAYVESEGKKLEYKYSVKVK